MSGDKAMKLTPSAIVATQPTNQAVANNQDFFNFTNGEAIALINGNEYAINISITGKDEPRDSFQGALIASAPEFMEQEFAGDILNDCFNSTPKRIWTNNVTETAKFIICAWYFTIKQADKVATARFELHYNVNKSIYQLYMRENNLEKMFLSDNKTSLNPDITNRRFFIQAYDGK